MPTAPSERDARVRQGLALVRLIAKRLVRRIGSGQVTVEDLESLGNYALVTIVDQWDPSRATFDAFASQRLTWAMRDGVRRETHGRTAAARARALAGSELVSEATASATEAAESRASGGSGASGVEDLVDPVQALDQILGAHAAAFALGLVGGGEAAAEEDLDPEARLLAGEQQRVLKDAVAKLPERERALVERHYFGDEPFEKIADDLRITRSWASRLHQRALVHVGELVGAVDRGPDDG